MKIQYDPLDTTRSQIRVLRPRSHVVTGDNSGAADCTSPLHFDLETVSLDDGSLRFVALSYVWGDPMKTKPIVIGDIEAHATLNLYDALHWLSDKPDLKRQLIWADALCIDQDNLEEKSCQIQLMARIYESSLATVCWLGSSTVRIQEYLRRGRFIAWGVSSCSKISFDMECASWLSLRLKSLFSRRARSKQLVRNLRTANGRLQFLNLEYFQRMWTMQESLLSGQRTLFVLGGEVCPFNPADAGGSVDVSEIMRDLGACLQTGQDVETNSKLGADIAEEIGSQTITDRQYTFSTEATWRPLGPSKSSQKPRFGLHALMRATYLRKCGDPRDKVFSLLGLLQTTETLLETQKSYLTIDYSKSPQQVFLDALAYIHEVESVENVQVVLTRFMPRPGGCGGPDKTLGSNHPENPAGLLYPSWLPDLTHPDRRRFYVSEKAEQAFMASFRARQLNSLRWIRLDSRRHGHPERLIFSCKFLGCVKYVMRFSPTANDQTILREASTLVYRAMLEWVSSGESNEGAQDSAGTMVACMALDHGKMFRLDSCLRQARSMMNDRPRFEFWLDHLHDSKERGNYTMLQEFRKFLRDKETAGGRNFWDHMESPTQRYKKALAESLRGQAVFVLENDALGLCSVNVQEGDQLVLSPEFARCLAIRPETCGHTSPKTSDCNTAPDAQFYKFVDWAHIEELDCRTDGDLLKMWTFAELQPWQEVVLV